LDVCGDDLPESFKIEAPCNLRLTIGLGILREPHFIASLGALVELHLQVISARSPTQLMC
jgi:hypothetical protein